MLLYNYLITLSNLQLVFSNNQDKMAEKTEIVNIIFINIKIN